MIEYVDQLLKHWAQEISAGESVGSLGVHSTWPSGATAIGSETGRAKLTARGTASRSGPKLGRLGKVAERVDQAVRTLTAREQEVIKVHYLTHNSSLVSERCAVLKCSTKNIYKTINRAHKKISAELPDSYAIRRRTYPHCG